MWANNFIMRGHIFKLNYEKRLFLESSRCVRVGPELLWVLSCREVVVERLPATLADDNRLLFMNPLLPVAEWAEHHYLVHGL